MARGSRPQRNSQANRLSGSVAHLDQMGAVAVDPQFDALVANDCARTVAQVLGRAHTLGQGLALAITDPRLDRHGPRLEISIKINDLRLLACCDDEAIHRGMRQLVRAGIVRWRHEPGPGTKAEWWVPTIPSAWTSSAANTPPPNISGETKRRKSAGAGNRYHACAFQAKATAETAYRPSISTGTSIETASEKTGNEHVRLTEADTKCDQSWKEAVMLLRGAGVTAGQEEGILRRMHPTLKHLPAALIVRAAIQEMGHVSKPGGWLRMSLLDGFPRILVRAQHLNAEVSSAPALLKTGEASPKPRQDALAKPKASSPQITRQDKQAPPSAEELEATSLWLRIRESLSKLIPAESFKEWIEPLRPQRLCGEGKILIIQAPSKSVKLWVEAQLEDEFEEAKVDAGLVDIHFEFVIASEGDCQ